MTVQPLRRRFTVHEYHRMGQVGILGEDDRLELLDGQIVEMAPIGGGEQATIDRLNYLIHRRAVDAAMASIHGPVRLADDSEPQPDLMLLQRRTDFYASGHPGPGDVLLLVEVSDSSTDYDREVKVPLYARHGIGEVWLVGLESETVEVYRGPGEEGYRSISLSARGQSLSPDALPELGLAVDNILG